MNKKSQLMLGAVGFIGFIVIASYGYTNLTNKYTVQELRPKTDQTQTLKEIERQLTKKKVLAPDFTVYDEVGNPVKLSDYRGTPVVLNFWASWCPPCRKEMPYFNKASETYKNEKIAILMVNLTDGQRETKETAQQYIKENQYDALHLLLDSKGDASNAYQISGIPTTMMIDKEGYIVDNYNGGIEEDVLIQGIDKLLE